MNFSPEIIRQSIHISMVVFALIMRFLPASWAFFLAFSAFVHNVLLLPKYAPQLFRERENLLQGIAVYPLMVSLLVLLFPDRLILAAGAWAILAFGDGFSTLVGKRFPLLPLAWNPHKSLGGLLAFFLCGCLGSFLIMSWFITEGTYSHLLLVAFFASLVAGIYETLPLPWDDNVIVTLIAAVMCALTWKIDPMLSGESLSVGWWSLVIFINGAVAGAAWWFGLVSTTGAFGGALIGSVVFALGGFALYDLLLLFFILATLATRFGYHEKAMMGIAQEKEGRRGAKHAFANCSLALIAAVFIGITDSVDPLLRLFYCAVLATAFCDTIASELGQLYGRNPFMPTSFRRVAPGTVGAISIEGTLLGMAASLLFALIAFSFAVIQGNQIPAVVIGAWLGSYSESYIGGFWTEEGVEVDNEWMNVLNTFVGGTIALFIAELTHAL